MKVTSKLKCECGSKFKISFKKPSAVQQTFDVVDCPDCESKIKFIARKAGKNQVNILTSTIPSDLLIEMKKESSEAKT